MSLLLHCGGKPATYEDIAAIPTPDRTATYTPVPYTRLINLVREEIRGYYWDYRVDRDLLELRNLADVAHIVVESALRRRESRGLHTTSDWPDSDGKWVRDTFIQRRLNV